MKRFPDGNDIPVSLEIGEELHTFDETNLFVKLENYLNYKIKVSYLEETKSYYKIIKSVYEIDDAWQIELEG
jgi:hypothetical protein